MSDKKLLLLVMVIILAISFSSCSSSRLPCKTYIGKPVIIPNMKVLSPSFLLFVKQKERQSASARFSGTQKVKNKK